MYRERELADLLELEDVLVEVMLQALIGKVDAELLETVVLVVFESKYVQNSDRQDLKKTALHKKERKENIDEK